LVYSISYSNNRCKIPLSATLSLGLNIASNMFHNPPSPH